MSEFIELPFNNPGVLIFNLPQDIWAQLQKSLDVQIKQKDIVKPLKTITFPTSMGIEESIHATVPKDFSDYAETAVIDYSNYFGLKPPAKITMPNVWLNLQKKHEFRPYHRHYLGNSHLSFVVWYKIPYLMADEDKVSNHPKAETFRNGRFEFMVDSFVGEKLFYRVDAPRSS